MTHLHTHLHIENSTDKELNVKRPFTFDGKLLDLLPKFYKEKIIGTETYKLLKYLTASEDILNILYTYTKKLSDIVDINLTHPKYMYQLGRLLGLDDLVDLTYSDDNTLIEKQRKYIRETIDRLLLKGTPESVIRLYYGLGILLNIRELWTNDFITLFDNDNFTKKYLIATDYDGDYNSLEYTYQGYLAEDFDLMLNIEADIPGSGITEITKYEKNNFNFYYVLTNAGLFFKDFNDTVGWLKYSETLHHFILKDDKIYIHKTDNTFNVYKYTDLTDILFSISNIYNFDVISIDSINYLLLDMSSKLELRNLVDYNIIDSVNKLNTNIMTDVVNKVNNDLLIFDTVNKEYYILGIGSGLSLSLLSGIINYSTKIPADTSKTFIRRFKDNVTNVFTSGPTYSLSKVEVVFNDENNIASYGFYIIPSLLEAVQDIFYHAEENILFYLSSNGAGIYDINTGSLYGEVEFIDSATYNYKRLFFLDNFYISKSDGIAPEMLMNFHGLTLYTGEVFKTHYFDLLLDSQTISGLSEETIATIKEVIRLSAPIHTYFRILFLNYSLTTEYVSMTDDLITTLDAAFELYHNGVYNSDLQGGTMPFYRDGNQKYDGTSDFVV